MSSSESRPRAVGAFVAGCIIVLAAMAWVTVHTLRLEQREAVAIADARFQETVRLVLWRMDSSLTPIIAREAARPYFEYLPFYPADSAFPQPTLASGTDEVTLPATLTRVLVPSPLLAPDPTFTYVYFQRDDQGIVTSPQAPTGDALTLARGTFTTDYALAAAQDRLQQLDNILRSSVPSSPTVTASSDLAPKAPTSRLLGSSGDQPVLDGPLTDRTFSRGSSADVIDDIFEIHPDSKAASNVKGDISISPIESARGGAPTPGSGVPVTLPEDNQGPSPPADAVRQNYGEYQARQQATSAAAQNDASRLRTRATPSGERGNVADAPPPPGGSSPSPPSNGESAESSPPASSQQQQKSLLADATLAPAEQAPLSGVASLYKDGEAAEVQPYAVLAAPSVESLPVLDALSPTLGENVEQGQFSARWLRTTGSEQPELMFERRVRIGAREYTQGIWLNWPSLKKMLLQTSAALIPAADLVPVLDLSLLAGDERALGRTLASIPVQLTTPAREGTTSASFWTPAKTTLSVMWGSVIGAISIAGIALWASLELAQRRGRFVSAVTHELRTPLTTFCLYSQMLADGMVRDEEAKRNYLNILKSESGRLARIVESVLDYARLSGARPVIRASTLTIADLVLTCRRPLLARCEQAGMELVISGDALRESLVTTDAALVERILFNLVDNACKYAVQSDDKTISLRVILSESSLTFTVSDHGPGVPSALARTLFRPFTRGEAHSNGSIPGLGLGLAISRGLADQLGATLTLEPSETGATFALRLPLTSNIST